MAGSLIKSMGIDLLSPQSLIVIGFALAVFCTSCGWLAHFIAREISFGMLGNPVVMFVSLWLGLIAFHALAGPLPQHAPLTIAYVAVASAIGGLLIASTLKGQPWRT
ncbi:MAG TPA: hypothetical protein PLQ11_00350 [Beijerinckiaceae bacterium]|nr:hypothetical protein [Beijerinckiaceae bacterium]